MAKDKTASVILQYEVDSASVNRVRASFVSMENELSDLRAELTGVGTSAQQGVNGLRQRFAAGEQSVESMQAEVESLRRELLALDDVNVTPTVNVQQAGGARGGVVGGLETVDRLGTIGSQIGSGLGSGEIGNVAGLFGDIGGAVATLNPVLIGATVAIGGLALITQDLARSADEAKAAQEAIYAGQVAAEALDIQAQIARRAQILQEVANLERQIDQRKADIAAADEVYADARERANTAVGGAGVNLVQLGNRLQAQQAAAQGDITEFSLRLTELGSEFFEIENAINPILRTLQGVRESLAPVGSVLGDLVGRFEDTVTSSANLVRTLAAAAPAINSLRDGIDNLRERALAQLAQLRADKTSNYLNAITQTVQAQENLTKAQNAYNEAVAASAGRIADINTKLQEELASAETNRQRDLAEAARQAGADRVKATEDAEKERARIQKRFDKSYAQAVGDRDALAAKRAEDQRDSDLEQLDERYKGQLEAVDKALENQQRTIEQRYNAQIQTVRAAAESSIRLEQQRAQAEINTRAQALQAAQVQLINAKQAELMITANFYNQSLSAAQIWAGQMLAYTSVGLGMPTGGVQVISTNGIPTGNQIGGGRVIATRAGGGPVTANTPYLVGEQGAELFVPAQSGRIMPHGAGITLNVVGAQMGTIQAVSRQQALATFGRVLDQMGVA